MRGLPSWPTKVARGVTRGFDSYLILQCTVKLGATPNLIMQGSKVLRFTDSDFGLKFIDWIEMTKTDQ